MGSFWHMANSLQSRSVAPASLMTCGRLVRSRGFSYLAQNAYKVLIAPRVPQDVGEHVPVGHGGHPVISAVRRHDGVRAAIHDGPLEGGEVGRQELPAASVYGPRVETLFGRGKGSLFW